MNKYSYATVESDNINEHFAPVFKKSITSEDINKDRKWSYEGIKHMFYQSLHWTHDPKKAGQELQQVAQQGNQHLQYARQESQQVAHQAGQQLHQAGQQLHQAGQQLHQAGHQVGHQAGHQLHQAKQEGSRWIENGKHHLIHQGKLWSHDASHWLHNGEHHMIHEGSHWFTNDGNVWTPYTNSNWRGGQNEKNLEDYHPMEYPKATGFEKLPFEGRAITGRWEATGDYN